MIPSKPKREESRRSSILKPQKPRQPLQNVNINSSSNENTPATSKLKRRVSFAEKKHVKEFCHSTEQGTVWDNTYEEHDSTLKASFGTDQSTKVESEENESKVTSEDDCVTVGIGASSNYTNSSNLTDSQPHASTVEVYEDDKNNDLNFTNPIEHMEIFSQKLPLGQTILPNAFKSTTSSSVITIYTDSDKDNGTSVISNEYCPEIHTNKVGSEMERTCIQDLSMEFTMMIPASLESVYHDTEDDKQKDTQKDNVASHQDNFDTNYTTMEMTKVASWRNKAQTFDPISKQQENIYERKDINNSITERTRLLHKSMDITEAISVSSDCKRIYNIEHAAESSISNCNNESMEITQIIPISVEPIKSDLEISRKVPVITQNYIVTETFLETAKLDCKDTRRDATSNSLTVIQSVATDPDVLNPNDNKNNADFNTSMEMTNALPSKIYKPNITQPYNKNVIEGNSLKKTWETTKGTDKTKLFNDVPMEMTRPVSMYERNIPYFHDEDTVSGKNLRKNRKTSENCEKTEFFSDAPMQMTRPVNVILPVSVYDKENLRTDEAIFRDNRNTFSQNTSVEMTKAVLSRNGREIFNPIIHGKNVCDTENKNSVTFSEKTKLLCKSMDITEAVPDPWLREKTCNIESTAESMEALISCNTTTPRTHLPEKNSARSSFQTAPAVNNNETIHNASMEMTSAVSSIMRHIESIKLRTGTENLNVSKRNEFQHSAANNVTEFRKSETRENVTIPRETVGTTNLHNTSSNVRVLTNNFDHSLSSTLTNDLLCKSVGITKTIPDPLLCEKTDTCDTELHEDIENTAEPTEALIFRNTTTSKTHLPKKNSARSPLQTEPDIHNNETIHNASMEITAAVPSVMHPTQNIILNGTENLGISKSNEFQRSVTNNITEFRKNEIIENVTVQRETVETISNTCALINDFDHSSSATLTNANRKRRSLENENTSAKKFRSDSLEEFQSPVCHNTHSSSRNDDNRIRNECSTEDTIDPARISILPCGSNVSDSLNNIDDCSFLKKNLENSLVELQSINPPSFVYVDSEDENSLFKGILQEDEPHASIVTDAIPTNNKNNNSQRLETTNVEHEETKDCHRSVVTNAIEHNQENDCQAKTIIDDNRIDQSNRYATGKENLNGGESAQSTSNIGCRKTAILSSTDHFTETEVTREDQEEKEIDEEKYILEEVNNDEVELPNIEQKKQCTEIREEVERHIDHLKETETIFEDQMDRDEYCQEHLNGNVNPDVEQKEDYIEERLEVKQCSNEIEEEPLIEQDPFLSLSQKVEAFAEGEDCIWNVYYKNVDRRMIAFGFMSNSLLIVTFLSDNLNHPEENLIKEIKIISRLADDTDVLMRIVHGLILEKINVETLTHSYSTHEDVLPMLDLISQEVKLAMNFMFDLKRLDDLNLMEIARDKISFVSRSKYMNIILKITINVKRFDKLTSSDVNIRCLLGMIKETDVKKLIKNVKKNHKFLSRYMNDVKDYIDIMEEISTTPS